MDLLGFTNEEVAELNSKSQKPKPKPTVPDAADIPDLPELSRFPEGVQEAIREAWRQELAKRRMREANEAARNAHSDPPKGLMAKIDKANRLIKKLKTISEANPDTLMAEMASMNLSKFIPEVVNSLCETKFASKDLGLLVEACNHLHQRYTDFSRLLEQCLLKTYHSSDFLRRRNLLRFISELIVSGVWRDTHNFGSILRDLACTTGDQDVKINYMNILATFLKFRGEDFTGLVPATVRRKVDEGQWMLLPKADILQRSTMEKVKALVTDYYPKGLALLKALEQTALVQEAKNKRLRAERGVVDSDNVEQLSNLRNLIGKVHGNMQIIADLLSFELEPLAVEEQESLTQNPDVPDEDISLGLFESEEDREMYEKLKKMEPAEPRGEEEKKTDPQQFEDVMKRLPQCITIKLIDEIAANFYKIAFKQNRKKLVNTLFGVSRNSLSLLPFYSRLAATLSQDYKDVGQKLVKKLVEEFRKLQADNDPLRIESKTKNARFLGELTKFRICPPDLLLECLETCIHDFAGHNIEVACSLLDCCGRFLYRNPETRWRVAAMLEILQRVKKSKNFPPQTEEIIDHAYFSCRPKDRNAHRRERPLVFEYIRYLIFNLHRDNSELTINIIKQLPMDQCKNYVLKALLSAVSKGKFNQIHLLTNMLAGLRAEKPLDELNTLLIDVLVEEILADLRMNDFRRNQHRTIVMRFFGELYSYKLITKETVFDMLYALLYYANDSDTPKDSFRVRLTCILLDTCGQYFTISKYKPMLDRFLIHFQHYVLQKTDLPLDLEFMVLDTLEVLQPAMRFDSGSDSIAAVKRAMDEERESTARLEADTDSESEAPIEDVSQAPPPLSDLPADSDEARFHMEFLKTLEESVEQSRARPLAKDAGRQIPSTVLIVDGSPTKHREGVTFKLLTKKGGKVVTKAVPLPEDSAFAVQATERMHQDSKDREALSRMVCDMHDRAQHEEELKSTEDYSQP